MIKKRQLGKTGIELSEVGFGASALFGKNVLNKQGITEEQAYELISTGIQNGVLFFDTGINYGYAEERLGRCLSEILSDGHIKRENLVIETKWGETIGSDGKYGPRDLSPEWLKKSIDISLKRLRLDYLDLYALHGECEIKYIDPIIKMLEDFKSQGVIKAYGVNTFDTKFIEWLAESRTFDYVMLDYNIMRQEREPLIEKLAKSGVGVIAGASLGQSLYLRKTQITRNQLWYSLRSMVKFRYMKQRSKDFNFLTKYDDYTANQLALRYVLDNEYVSSAVFNTTRTEHLLDNIKATEIRMPNDIRMEIKKRSIG